MFQMKAYLLAQMLQKIKEGNHFNQFHESLVSKVSLDVLFDEW